MRNFNRLFLGGMIIAAVFIIFNCAGYLAITLLFANKAATAPAQPAAQPTAAVVSFSTPPPVSTGPPPSPLPLLPTVTPGGPAPQPTPAGPTKTDTPPPAAAAAPGQLEIVSHKSYVDSLGWYHIVGEVQNNTATPMAYVEVVAKLYNTVEEVIGTKLTFTAPDLILPGGVAPFDIIALRQAQWQEIKQYTLQVKGDVSSDYSPQNMVLVSQNSQIQAGLMIISGQVKNVGTSPALAKLIVTLYDADHNVINTGWSYADGGVIAANNVATFEVKVNHNTDPNNFQYRIQIEEETIGTN